MFDFYVNVLIFIVMSLIWGRIGKSHWQLYIFVQKVTFIKPAVMAEWAYASTSSNTVGSELELALELHSRTVPSEEAHLHVNGPNTGKNSEGRQIIKK